MSKLLKRLNDNQNKVADTNGIMKLQAWDYGVAQDLTNKKITATVANASGFLFDIDLVSNGTEIDLDFKDSQLQKLTPDTYFLEIKVTDEAGDVSVFPTEGYATFTINKNLHATEGALVPQITFDTVLADVKTAMDEKVADYVKTIAKGDKGDTGPAGKDAEMPVVGGRNLVLGTSKQVVQATNWNMQVADIKYDKSLGKTICASVMINNADHASALGKGSASIMLETLDQSGQVLSTIYGKSVLYNADGLSWVSTTLDENTASVRVRIWTNNMNGNAFYSRLKVERGNVATDWTPAPEDAPSNDPQLVHNTGNEIIAGNKTFSGNTTIGGTLMTDSGWKNMSLVSGVTASVARYRLLNGIVYIQALYVTTDVGKVFATLPAGYRPPYWIWESYFSDNKSGNFLITNKGEISRESSTTSGTNSGTNASFIVSYPID